MAHRPIIKILWACGSPTPTLIHWSLWVTHIPQIVINIQSLSILSYIYLLVTAPVNLVMVTRNHAGSMWVRLWDVVWAGGALKVSPTHIPLTPPRSSAGLSPPSGSHPHMLKSIKYSARSVGFLEEGFGGVWWPSHIILLSLQFIFYIL